MGQITEQFGPDLLTTCGNPRHILSVGTAYVVGIGGACSYYNEWTPCSDYPANHLETLNNRRSSTGSSAGLLSPSLLVLYVSAAIACFKSLIM